MRFTLATSYPRDNVTIFATDDSAIRGNSMNYVDLLGLISIVRIVDTGLRMPIELLGHLGVHV